MTTAIKRRRGTTAQHATFTGLEGEITVDTTKDTLVVHDGATAGGYPLLREDLSNNTNVITTTNTKTLTNKTFGDNPTLSAGTANGVAYLNGSKVLTTGSALTFDGTNLGVGYTGTLSPNVGRVGLTLNGTAESIIAFGRSSSLVGFILQDASGQTFYNGDNTFQRFYVGGSEQMRLTSTGLGIGTSIPTAGKNITLGNDSSGTATVGLSFATSGQERGSITVTGSSGEQKFTAGYAGYGGWQTFHTNGSERMRLDSSGNLGLGVTPSAWTITPALQVKGASIISEGDNLYLSANAFYGSSAWTYKATNYASQYYQLNGAHVWRTAPSGTAGNAISFTQAMTLDASGNVMVGTTSASAKMCVETSGNSYGVFSSNTNTATTSNYLFWGYSSSNTRFIVYGNGGIANYSANNVNLSDRSVKTDFAPAKSYLDIICAIPVQTFKYTDQQDDDLNLGVVAQDVQAVAPELVTEANWGTEESPEMRLSIYQTDLQYALMKAIQELKAELDATKAEVAALKGN